MAGVEARLGNRRKQDFAISIQVMLALQEILEEEWELAWESGAETRRPTFTRRLHYDIMDIILSSRLFTPKQIRQLNLCRLYLQAVTISDISDSDGLYVDPHMEDGSPSLYSPTTALHQVNQGKPSAACFKLWRRASQLWSDEHGQLHTPLKDWLVPPSQQRMSRFAYYDDEDGTAYLSNGSRYDTFFVDPNYSTFSIHPDTKAVELPDTATPITVDQRDDFWQIRTISSTTTPLRLLLIQKFSNTISRTSKRGKAFCSLASD